MANTFRLTTMVVLFVPEMNNCPHITFIWWPSFIQRWYNVYVNEAFIYASFTSYHFMIALVYNDSPLYEPLIIYKDFHKIPSFINDGMNSCHSFHVLLT